MSVHFWIGLFFLLLLCATFYFIPALRKRLDSEKMRNASARQTWIWINVVFWGELSVYLLRTAVLHRRVAVAAVIGGTVVVLLFRFKRRIRGWSAINEMYYLAYIAISTGFLIAVSPIVYGSGFWRPSPEIITLGDASITLNGARVLAWACAVRLVEVVLGIEQCFVAALVAEKRYSSNDVIAVGISLIAIVILIALGAFFSFFGMTAYGFQIYS